jgi:predicted GNAT family acetyltransferase
MTDRVDYDITDRPEASRYEATTTDGDVIGVLEYQREDGVVVMPSTRVEPAFRGHGIAAALVRRALDEARSARASVVPVCWYVAEYVERHPEYADLVDE